VEAAGGDVASAAARANGRRTARTRRRTTAAGARMPAAAMARRGEASRGREGGAVAGARDGCDFPLSLPPSSSAALDGGKEEATNAGVFIEGAWWARWEKQRAC
jgi:hypothetical protein